MEKRKFTKEQMDDLQDICNEGEFITINGISSDGVPFKVRGRIAHDDKGKPGVYKDVLMIEFGTEKEKPTNQQTKWFAPYELNVGEGVSKHCKLIIESITADSGELIYKDDNFAEIESVVNELREEHLQDIQFRTICKYDKVATALQNLVGHPITLDGITGILLRADHVSDNGSVLLDVLYAAIMGGAFVETDSVLKTIDENGNEIVVAVNDMSESDRYQRENKPSREGLEAERDYREKKFQELQKELEKEETKK